MENADNRWERDVLRDLALEGVKERRRARRWGIFFKALLFIYLFSLLAMSPSCQWSQLGGTSVGEHTAVVDVTGPIMAEAPASANRIIRGLENAFEAEGVKGVVLNINSPGGSPVQSDRVNRAIDRLRAANPDIPLYAVAGDVCASGAYYMAVAADRIYGNRASLVGSIGVLMNGFGFTRAMEELGVERRLYTAGRNKSFLDPFSPVQERHVEHVNQMLDEIHQQFIERVKAGRGERLADDERVFSGLVWTGVRGKELGLIDDFGSVDSVARDVVGAERTVNYTPQRSFLDRFSDRVGAGAARVLANTLGLERWSLR
ncbi:S49 family peptidase [Ectothiorhodospiraceae bacterium WFHF3C12]|nr:S49 family peptidase [Ectothiorhodospiraceae bacterium WFHF3C12]